MAGSRLVCAALAAVLGVVSLAAEPEPAATPEPAAKPAASAKIDALHAVLLEVMKQAEKLGLEGRSAKLAPVLDATYDFPAMAQRSLGASWATLDEAQRARFVQAFRGMTLRTYASRFTGFAGESFETKGQEDSVAGTVIVRSVVHAKPEEVALDYRLRDTPNGWRVIDVYLNGTVSELALRRAEYSALLERDGFEALLSGLEHKLGVAPGAPGAQGVPGAASPPSSD